MRYDSYNFNQATGVLTAAGTDDRNGNFVSESTVNMATGQSMVRKEYSSGMVIDMVVDEVPDDSFMFFGEFTFTSNVAGFEGNGRFANAFVEDAQSSFDSRNEQPFHTSDVQHTINVWT